MENGRARTLTARRKNRCGGGELRIADLESGRSEPVVHGLKVHDYDISADGKRVAVWTTDHEGKSRLWVAALDRSTIDQPVTRIVHRHAVNYKVPFTITGTQAELAQAIDSSKRRARHERVLLESLCKRYVELKNGRLRGILF